MARSPRARQELTGAALAPKNEETLQEMRRQRPEVQVRPIPPAVLEFEPDTPLTMDRKFFFHSCLHGAPLDVAPGPGGCTNEMLRTYLDDAETLSLLLHAAEDFARGHVLDDVCHALMLATMTGLQKRDGGVRGIATGTSFRRLVAKVLARQFSDAVEATCAPFQFALSTRAGTDCVGHAVRVATELNPRLTVLSIDGVGAYDHIFRSAMLSKVAEVPSLQGLLPFVHTPGRVRTSGQTKRASNTRLNNMRVANKATPLMPLLFSLGIHDALSEVQQHLQPGECLFAYLDDVHVFVFA